MVKSLFSNIICCFRKCDCFIMKKKNFKKQRNKFVQYTYLLFQLKGKKVDRFVLKMKAQRIKKSTKFPSLLNSFEYLLNGVYICMKIAQTCKSLIYTPLNRINI
jgi:hypothetical protein